MPDPQPADPNKGFPNPLHPDYEGERTPEEQVAFDEAQARQAAIDAAGGTPAPATEPNPYAPQR